MRNHKLRVFHLPVIVLLFVLWGAPSALAQEWVRQLFPVKEHDFETVPRGAKAHYRFEITNPFEEEIHLSAVTGNCVCVTPLIETPVLKSHETGTILVHFNTDKVSGSQKATLNVSIDKPYPAVATLQVRGHVRNDITFEPSSVLFGSVPVGEAREKTVKVIYHGKNAFWNLLFAESSNPNLAVEIGQTTPRRGRTEVELKLKLDKDAPIGPLGENLFLTSSDTAIGRIPLLIEGEVRPPIVARPQEFSLGTVHEGEEIVRPVVLIGDKPFLVKELLVSDNDPENLIAVTLQTPLETEPKSTHVYRLKLTVPKVTEHKSVRETIVFETDNPDVSPTLTVLAVVKPMKNEQ